MSKQIPERPLQPSDLSQDQVARLVAGLKRGAFPATACRMCGLSPAVYDRWMRKGADAKRGQYADFHRDMKAAEAEAEQAVVEAWRDQLDGSSTACRDFLKLRFPERWGGVEEKHQPLVVHFYIPERKDAP